MKEEAEICAKKGSSDSSSRGNQSEKGAGLKSTVAALTTLLSMVAETPFVSNTSQG